MGIFMYLKIMIRSFVNFPFRVNTHFWTLHSQKLKFYDAFHNITET